MENFNEKYATHPALDLLKEYCLKYGICKDVKKKERFAIQGVINRYGAYIEDGVFRYIKKGANGNEYIVGYAFAKEFLGNLASFIDYSQPSLVTIEAVRDSKIYSVSFEDVECFFETNDETQRIRRVLVDNSYLGMYSRLLDSYCKSTEERYLELLKKCPQILQILTLKEIASYLKVTPTTMSNIRRKITFGN